MLDKMADNYKNDVLMTSKWLKFISKIKENLLIHFIIYPTKEDSIVFEIDIWL